MPEATIVAFARHGTLARTVDQDPAAEVAALSRIGAAGIDLPGITSELEEQAVAAFTKSFDAALALLAAKANDHRS